MMYECVGSCVDLRGTDIEAMIDVSREIAYKTFRFYVDVYKLSIDFGYRSRFGLKNDYYVRYFKSKFKGEKCYYMVHSAIEYVYC